MDELLSQLSPEELEQLLGLGTLDERGALFDDQMAQAQALQQRPTVQRSTGAGAALSGLANAIRQYQAGSANAEAMAGRKALLDQKDAGRKAYAEAMAKWLRNGARVPDSAGMGDLMLPPGMG